MVFDWSCIALVDSSVKLFEVLFLPASILLVNTPIMKLLVEHVLCILVWKFWENLSVISQVIYKSFEGMPISIQEHFLINFFQLVHVGEKFGKCWSFDRLEDELFGLQMGSSTNIEAHDLWIVFDFVSNFLFLGFPKVSLNFDLTIFVIK